MAAAVTNWWRSMSADATSKPIECYSKNSIRIQWFPFEHFHIELLHNVIRGMFSVRELRIWKAFIYFWGLFARIFWFCFCFIRRFVWEKKNCNWWINCHFECTLWHNSWLRSQGAARPNLMGFQCLMHINSTKRKRKKELFTLSIESEKYTRIFNQ